MSFPDIPAHFLAFEMARRGEAKQPYPGVIGIIGAFDKFFFSKAVDYFSHPALSYFKLLRDGPHGQIPFSAEKKKTPGFGLRDAKLAGEKPRLHLAAVKYLLNQFFEAPGLILKKFVRSVIVHSDNDYNLPKIPSQAGFYGFFLKVGQKICSLSKQFRQECILFTENQGSQSCEHS
jgi:hypothetical protein